MSRFCFIILSLCTLANPEIYGQQITPPRKDSTFKVIITEIEIAGRILPITDSYNIGYEDNAIEIKFVTQPQTSDILYSVARQYNVTIKEIMDWNGKSDFTLAQGEKLKILSK